MAVDVREPAAVFVGGAAGTLARAAVVALAAPHPGTWPWATFAVNVAGAFILGLVLTWLRNRPSGSGYPRALLSTGFCGGLTTFSTMQVETLAMIEHGHYALALGYTSASVVTGLAVFAVTRRLWRPVA
ncbi:fluoride efflux transporter CrcB [Mycolicibacterium vaccae]|uniref:fluoride efflux transporter CrcB n=1 Tax=Mycolicibacterium vaccae TaxID=1810 RepID=UPI003CF48FA5